MTKPRLAPLALALAVAHGAQAASLTPPNLVAASSLNNPDLLLVWPYAAGGPLEAISWSAFKAQMASGLTGSFLTPSNNLSDVGNPTIARTNLGLGSAALASTGTSGASLCQLSSACTWSALQSFAASTTSGASINLAPGAPPTSPNNGDVWTTSNGVFAQVGGATYALAGPVAEAYVNAPVSNVTGDGTTYTIIFNSTQVNRGSAYSTSTGTFTAPVTGLYQVNLTLQLTGLTTSDTTTQVAIVTTTASYNYFGGGAYPDVGGTQSMSVSALASMSAGDALTALLKISGSTKTVGVNGGTGAGNVGRSFLSVRLVD